MSERVDVVVIGAGVVGLAVSRALAEAGREVVIVERHGAIGTETSSRNSEVIHAGLPYRPGGLRARLAVKGRDALYRFCVARGVAFARCGKLVIANGEDEVARIRGLVENAEKNGVGDLRVVPQKEARRLEPGLRCDAAILSPSSGVVDSHGLMVALLGDAENAGAVLALNSEVLSGRLVENGVALRIKSAQTVSLNAKLVVNCAGLSADRVARSIAGVPEKSVPRLYYGKGQYFSYAGKAPFSRLIYPLPAPHSLGVHYTRDLGGQAKLGPDIVFIDSHTDTRVDATRRDAFAAAARKFWPDLAPERLNPDYAGIRPKIAGPGKEGDFRIDGPETHGAKGYIGLYGIESPGLTACLAIADEVAALAAACEGEENPDP